MENSRALFWVIVLEPRTRSFKFQQLRETIYSIEVEGKRISETCQTY